MKLTDVLNQLKSEKNRKLADRNTDRFLKTKKDKYAKRALYHSDKAYDYNLLATAPNKEAKKYVKANRDRIETNRMNDYLQNGVGKEFYED